MTAHRYTLTLHLDGDEEPIYEDFESMRDLALHLQQVDAKAYEAAFGRKGIAGSYGTYDIERLW